MKIHEIFLSIDGEVNKWGQGTWSTFIRMQGCPCRCGYCDTVYAQDKDGGTEFTIQEVLTILYDHNCRKVTITGGEPCYQYAELKKLLRQLKWNNYKISIETNGLYPIADLLPFANVIMDWKLPSSGEQEAMNNSNWAYLRGSDYVKFVIQDKEDYQQAKRILGSFYERGQIAFSPCFPMSATDLLKLMKQDQLFHIQLNVQLHKILSVK